MILLDANILLRMADRADPLYDTTRNAVFQKRRTDQLVIVPQTLFEFWAVATCAAQHNGLGMDTERAQRWVTHTVRCSRPSRNLLAFSTAGKRLSHGIV